MADVENAVRRIVEKNAIGRVCAAHLAARAQGLNRHERKEEGDALVERVVVPGIAFGVAVDQVIAPAAAFQAKGLFAQAIDVCAGRQALLADAAAWLAGGARL